MYCQVEGCAIKPWGKCTFDGCGKTLCRVHLIRDLVNIDGAVVVDREFCQYHADYRDFARRADNIKCDKYDCFLWPLWLVPFLCCTIKARQRNLLLRQWKAKQPHRDLPEEIYRDAGMLLCGDKCDCCVIASCVPKAQISVLDREPVYQSME